MDQARSPTLARSLDTHLLPGQVSKKSQKSLVGLVTTIQLLLGVYAFSKAAVHSMTDALRLELAPLGIQVILVAPGGVTSNFGNNAVTTIDIPEGK